MANDPNLAYGAPPLGTPILAEGPDQFGIPFQNRDGPGSGNLNPAWAAFFSALYTEASVAAAATANLGLTIAYQDVVGATVELNRTGLWLIIGVFELFTEAACGIANGQLVVGPPPVGPYVAQSGLASLAISAGDVRATVTQVWIYNATERVTAKLQAKKSINAGLAFALLENTTITAVWLKRKDQ